MITDNFNSAIEFIFLEVSKFPFPENNTRKWILHLIEQEKKEPGILNFIFCKDEYLLEINKQFLNHDTLTDIVTFDYSEEFDNVSGDIYISIDRVEENSVVYSVSFLHELHRVIAHGVLHILGYKDKLPEEKEIMTLKENQYLKAIVFL